MKTPVKSTDVPAPRKGMPTTKLSKAEFTQRYHAQFFDPAFDSLRSELDEICNVAWKNYHGSRKSPVTQKAGPGYANPAYDLSVEWQAASAAIAKAQKQHDDSNVPPRVLLINGSVVLALIASV